MDVSWPAVRLRGRAIQQLVALPCRPRVLLICSKPEPRVAATVLKCRFYGYIAADGETGALLNAVRCVSRGELWVPRLALADARYGSSHARPISADRSAS